MLKDIIPLLMLDFCRKKSKLFNMAKKNWSGAVTKGSNALDLDAGVFTWKNPRKIALSLKRSALKSNRRKAAPYMSAMSMLNFYINRAGKNLSPKEKSVLQKAKVELRKAFDKTKR